MIVAASRPRGDLPRARPMLARSDATCHGDKTDMWLLPVICRPSERPPSPPARVASCCPGGGGKGGPPRRRPVCARLWPSGCLRPCPPPAAPPPLLVRLLSRLAATAPMSAALSSRPARSGWPARRRARRWPLRALSVLVGPCRAALAPARPVFVRPPPLRRLSRPPWGLRGCGRAEVKRAAPPVGRGPHALLWPIRRPDRQGPRPPVGGAA